MSETKNKNKRRLSIITLTLFANKFSDQTLSKRKAPKIFEEPSGVVGLGIVAAMHDGGLPNLGNRASVLALPLPSHGSSTGRKTPSSEEMEMSEEYTCVISHVGKNLVKKEYFDGDFLGVTEGVSEKFIFGTSVGGDVASGDWISSDLVDHYSFGGAQSFLNSCFLCNKQLHGLDIFMYRGETAFCSAECRYKQIFVDENEKCGSRMMTKHTHSFQCFSGVTSA